MTKPRSSAIRWMSAAVSVGVPLACSSWSALIAAIFLAVSSLEPNTDVPAKPRPDVMSPRLSKPLLVAAPKPSKKPTSSGRRVSAGFSGVITAPCCCLIMPANCLASSVLPAASAFCRAANSSSRVAIASLYLYLSSKACCSLFNVPEVGVTLINAL